VNIADIRPGREAAYFKVSICTAQDKIAQEIADTRPCRRAEFEPVIPLSQGSSTLLCLLLCTPWLTNMFCMQ
jgi:hypothetical protein